MCLCSQTWKDSSPRNERLVVSSRKVLDYYFLLSNNQPIDTLYMHHSARTYAIEHYSSHNGMILATMLNTKATNPSKSSSEIYPIQPFCKYDPIFSTLPIIDIKLFK